MASIKLISVHISDNYVEQGDALFITATWQCCGNQPDFDAEITADLTCCKRHRRDENQPNCFRFSWKPFPFTYQWKQGEVWCSTGKWEIPATWGGSFELNISLIAENGESIEFIGKDGEMVYSQFVSQIEVGWGWGRNMLLEQRRPISVMLNSQTTYPKLSIDFEPKVTFRKISNNKTLYFIGNNDIEYSVKKEPSKSVYSACCRYGSFDAVITFFNGGFDISIENVIEKEDYEFISLDIPLVAKLSGKDAELINFYGGGRVCPLSVALYQSQEFSYDTCNVVAVASVEKSVCVTTDNFETVLRQSVIGDGVEKTICIGAVIKNKIPANKAGLKSIPAEIKPISVICENGYNPMLSAKILQSRINTEARFKYENTIMYKLTLDNSGQYNEANPATYLCRETRDLKYVRDFTLKMYELSGGIRQVVYLVGWQQGGHDFAYPYSHMAPFNEKCGSKEEFNALREELKKYNIELSLHDNFDDAYISDFIDLNEDILSVDDRGELWCGWLWAGGLSYIISPTAYVNSGEMQDRVRKTLSDYGIEKTYHLDVLSSELRRYSFRQSELSNAADNINMKIKIIDEFNKYGVDVTSETLAMPFISRIGYAQNTRCNFDNSLFFGDKTIPLTTAAFHGFIPYKVSASGNKNDILKAVAFGGACSIEAENCGVTVNLLRNLYLSTLPMMRLSYKKVIGTAICENKWIINYEDDSTVSVDFEAQEYTVIYNGEVISRNFKTFMLLSESSYVYFSLENGKTECCLPDNFNKFKLYELSADNEKKLIECENFYDFEAVADKAYIIERN